MSREFPVDELLMFDPSELRLAESFPVPSPLSAPAVEFTGFGVLDLREKRPMLFDTGIRL